MKYILKEIHKNQKQSIAEFNQLYDALNYVQFVTQDSKFYHKQYEIEDQKNYKKISILV